MQLQSTVELHEEHEDIRRGLVLLRAVGGGIEGQKTEAAEDARQLMRFFSLFGDKCHHSKEERHFFPSVEAARLPFDQDSIDTLVREHREGWEYLEAMQRQLDLYNEGDASAGAVFRQQADAYAEMLDGHIDREEEEILHHAEAAFSAQEDRRLAVAFERLERQEIGEGVHEEFHALLEDLERRYAPSEGE